MHTVREVTAGGLILALQYTSVTDDSPIGLYVRGGSLQPDNSRLAQLIADYPDRETGEAAFDTVAAALALVYKDGHADADTLEALAWKPSRKTASALGIILGRDRVKPATRFTDWESVADVVEKLAGKLDRLATANGCRTWADAGDWYGSLEGAADLLTAHIQALACASQFMEVPSPFVTDGALELMASTAFKANAHG